MDTRQQAGNLLSNAESRLIALRAGRIDQINFLSPNETILDEIEKLERLCHELQKERYKTLSQDLEIVCTSDSSLLET